MSIKLTGATSGSIEIDVPDAVSGGDISLTLPNGVGSVGQVLKNSGTAGTLEFAQGGKILQVAQSVKADRASIVGGTFGDTGLSVNITPSSTSSNILVMVHAHIGHSNAYEMSTKLQRDNADISGALGDADGGRPASTSLINVYKNVTQDQYTIIPTTIVYLDTAVSTTSQVNYKLQMKAYSTYTVYLNRTASFQNQAGYDSTPVSTITAMEIEG
tara:strand:- start:219 stop:863 length:645 start_codon:yes stop_codon:yes gene_type:complete